MRSKMKSRNREALFIETACGRMMLQIVLLLHIGGLSNIRTIVVGISHCGGGSLMTRA